MLYLCKYNMHSVGTLYILRQSNDIKCKAYLVYIKSKHQMCQQKCSKNPPFQEK